LLSTRVSFRFNNLMNYFNKTIDRNNSYHVGRYKAYQKLLLRGCLDPVSNQGPSKSQLLASLVAANVTVRPSKLSF
jgi:hypothetical protein